MQELDYDHTVHMNEASREADKALAVRFFTGPIQNDARSIEEGRPIFDDVVQVEIRVRGDRNNVVIRPVRPEDKRRFRDAWRAFEDNATQRESGTPLGEWPIMTASMAKELEFLGFFTVEQLAQANDTIISRMAGLTTMREKARAYLELAKGAAPIEKFQAELEEERAKRAALENQVAELARLLKEKTAARAADAEGEVGGGEEGAGGDADQAATPAARAVPRARVR